MVPEALLALEALVQAFERQRVRYVIGGSIASGAWGEPRTTHDVDVLAELRAEQVTPLVNDLKRTFYADEALAFEALRAQRSFNVIHHKYHLKIDVFVAGQRLLDDEQMERRIARRLHPEVVPLFVSSPEVIVLRKLDWFRMGDEVSERQLRDVVSVMKVQAKTFDVGYARGIARQLGLEDLLSRALCAAGLEDR